MGPFRPADPALREGPVKPGNYQTAINVHNPTRRRVTLVKKAVLMFDSQNPPVGFEVPMPPGQRFVVNLRRDWGFEIDCPDIRQVLLGQSSPAGPPFPFLKGWVVLETFLAREQLDVVAAYTSHALTDPPMACVGGANDGLPCTTNADCPAGVCTAVGIGDPVGFSVDVERVLPQ